MGKLLSEFCGLIRVLIGKNVRLVKNGFIRTALGYLEVKNRSIKSASTARCAVRRQVTRLVKSLCLEGDPLRKKITRLGWNPKSL